MTTIERELNRLLDDGRAEEAREMRVNPHKRIVSSLGAITVAASGLACGDFSLYSGDDEGTGTTLVQKYHVFERFTGRLGPQGSLGAAITWWSRVPQYKQS